MNQIHLQTLIHKATPKTRTDNAFTKQYALLKKKKLSNDIFLPLAASIKWPAQSPGSWRSAFAQTQLECPRQLPSLVRWPGTHNCPLAPWPRSRMNWGSARCRRRNFCSDCLGKTTAGRRRERSRRAPPPSVGSWGTTKSSGALWSTAAGTWGG